MLHKGIPQVVRRQWKQNSSSGTVSACSCTAPNLGWIEQSQRSQPGFTPKPRQAEQSPLCGRHLLLHLRMCRVYAALVPCSANLHPDRSYRSWARRCAGSKKLCPPSGAGNPPNETGQSVRWEWLLARTSIFFSPPVHATDRARTSFKSNKKILLYNKNSMF